MSGLSTLGIIHTAISLVAVGAGVAAFVRDRGLSSHKVLGKLYVLGTVLTCLTGFGIFAHGGFGKAHALGVITLLVLALAWSAGQGRLGAKSLYIETVAYSLTFFFHMIPAITETATRLPAGRPLLDSPEAPQLQAATGILFLLFLLGAWLQVRRLRAAQRATVAPMPRRKSA
jgi:uncharacterized membrane protein